ncbi:hypothetical protein ASF49_11140 [Methylobacterium sp. Leaf104]|uniref:hypothetical protein n=1 Tax=Methylobacterium TaxID=407 RepID=UPI0006FB816E|nr:MULTISPECIES: hypothetical protein [Methylobacterium]KQP31125.1 hypothetical protein ASF49_11140 [Methylobacterium sp. Leaf104]MCI9881211.1 hypothetical protein [Methylobacterium goesingense]
MSSSHSLTSVDISEYDRIEAAMTESERGRWFLDAYLRRNRTSDTGILLDAIARLESVVTNDRESSQIGRVRGDVMDMAHAIARTKAEIAAINAPDQDQSRLGGASAALDAIVRSTERATSEILSAAESVQEAAWTLRESGSDAAICDELDRRATAIYTACSFQDLTAQRTARIIHTLRYLEERLAAMMGIWGDALDPVPAGPGGPGTPEVPADLCQSDVDRYIDMDASSAEPVPPLSPTLRPVPNDPSAEDDIVFLEATDAVGIVAAEPSPEFPDESEPEVVALDVDVPSAAPAAAESAPADDPDLADMAALADSGMQTEADPETGFEAVAPETTDPVDDRPAMMTANTLQVSERAQTDIATAFAEIDALSDDEKRALFS